MKTFVFALVFVLLITFCLTSCGPTKPGGLPASSTGCGTGTGTAAVAQVAVSDGYLKTLCGCQETTPVVTRAGSTLTCTVSSGTHVFFQYQGSFLAHQIVSVGQPSFTPSSVSDTLRQSRPIRSHVIQLQNPGTYVFQDQYEHALQGQIVVQ